MQLLRYNSHICYVNNINASFQSFRCPTCDTFSYITFNLERRLNTYSERVKNICPGKVHQNWETLFDKLDSFGIKKTCEQELFKSSSTFHLESTSVQEQTVKDTSTKTKIGKHVPISVSICLNFEEESIFLCNSDPHHLVASFIGAHERLVS